ncbi:hypothetical protein MA16_Dca019188 [Dendrobium catenatum]|uniref:DUF4216 domain-containing protein n=1 Tax=Dendrobium catenatum TaxID=906689 RepID=A0A2I0VYD8_9ASPA|nr:hypothetical protein MA16_Dca019188 [Dendrobium catenatum]
MLEIKHNPRVPLRRDLLLRKGFHFVPNIWRGIAKILEQMHSHLKMKNVFMFSSGGIALGKVSSLVLDEKSLTQVHRYVLRHCDSLIPLREHFKDGEKRKRRVQIHLITWDVEKLINEKFLEWLRVTVSVMGDGGPEVTEEIKVLAKGPNKIARTYKGFFINGYTFHIKTRDENKKTQNYGVVNSTEIGSFNYYGKINDIIEINYSYKFKVILFKCDWENTTGTGIKQDHFGYTLVNFSRLIHTGDKLEDDPFVFSSQDEPVYYIQDLKNTNWNFVVRMRPRDVYDSSISRSK